MEEGDDHLGKLLVQVCGELEGEEGERKIEILN